MAQRLQLTELDVRQRDQLLLDADDEPRASTTCRCARISRVSYAVAKSCSTHCKKKLGVGHIGTTQDGLFSLEEVECIGAASWAPAVQVNYDSRESNGSELNQVLDGY